MLEKLIKAAALPPYPSACGGYHWMDEKVETQVFLEAFQATAEVSHS